MHIFELQQCSCSNKRYHTQKSLPLKIETFKAYKTPLITTVVRFSWLWKVFYFTNFFVWFSLLCLRAHTAVIKTSGLLPFSLWKLLLQLIMAFLSWWHLILNCRCKGERGYIWPWRCWLLLIFFCQHALKYDNKIPSYILNTKNRYSCLLCPGYNDFF